MRTPSFGWGTLPKLKERSSNLSIDVAKIMANGDWEHFEARYYDGIQDGKKKLSFPSWLDWRCEGGWEVLKISRDFSSVQNNTWVVFRKQV